MDQRATASLDRSIAAALSRGFPIHGHASRASKGCAAGPTALAPLAEPEVPLTGPTAVPLEPRKAGSRSQAIGERGRQAAAKGIERRVALFAHLHVNARPQQTWIACPSTSPPLSHKRRRYPVTPSTEIPKAHWVSGSFRDTRRSPRSSIAFLLAFISSEARIVRCRCRGRGALCVLFFWEKGFLVFW
jgi:hypothetical protein